MKNICIGVAIGVAATIILASITKPFGLTHDVYKTVTLLQEQKDCEGKGGVLENLSFGVPHLYIVCIQKEVVVAEYKF